MRCIANTTGHDNVATGSSALTANTTGNQQRRARGQLPEASTTANANSAVGRSSLVVNSTGPDNAAEGYRALRQLHRV